MKLRPIWSKNWLWHSQSGMVRRALEVASG